MSNMDEAYYLLDSVAIIRLDKSILAGDFVKKHCRISEEVVNEVRHRKKISMLEENVIPVTPKVLSIARDLLTTNADSKGLIDLYKNEGNGDILQLATIIVEKEKVSLTLNLFNTNWTLVTDDIGLSTFAESLGINAISSDEFKVIAA